jgi:ATP-dependent DNA helicase RecG
VPPPPPSGTFTRLLRARSLLTPKNEVSNAAYLLFAPHPQDRFPNAHVRVLRFLTTERGTGRNLNLDDAADTRIEGPIPQVINEAAS